MGGVKVVYTCSVCVCTCVCSVCVCCVYRFVCMYVIASIHAQCVCVCMKVGRCAFD